MVDEVGADGEVGDHVVPCSRRWSGRRDAGEHQRLGRADRAAAARITLASARAVSSRPGHRRSRDLGRPAAPRSAPRSPGRSVITVRLPGRAARPAALQRLPSLGWVTW